MTNKYILLLCGLLVGCQTSQKKEAEATPCQTIDLTTVFEQEPTEISLDEWAKEVRFVPLETSDSVLLTPYIWQLAYYQDQFVIYNNDKIYLFDNAGKFIRMIGSKGEGPEEYLRPGTPCVNETGIRLEDGGKRIKTYGWDGKWKHTANLPARLQHVNEVIPLPDGRNIGYVQNISGQEPIRMYLYRDSTVLDSIPYARKFTPGKIAMVFYNECRAFTDKGDIFVKEMFNDTIYQITNENKLVPRWAIDAGKYRLEEGERYHLQDPRNSLFVEKNAVQISVIGINRDTMAELFVYDEEGNYLGREIGQIALQHAYGDGMEESCERTVEAVSNLFYGIPIHGYFAMNMDVIIPLNDAVGGVDVVIGDGDENIEITDGEKRLYQADWEVGEKVHLEGPEAYSFVRNRDMYAPHSAEQRLKRQKQYLEAFARQAKKAVAQDLTLPAKLYTEILPYMVTDISASEAVYLATQAVSYTFGQDNLYSLEVTAFAVDIEKPHRF